jgi:hypothetical protein
MAFANVNIGSAPADGSGDPLRTAFSKINQNFANIATGSITVNAPVRTVAGRTGNIILTVNDIIGAASNSSVISANTAMKSYVDDNISDVAYGNSQVAAYLPTSSIIIGINANVTAANSAINSLVSNAAIQSALLDTLTSNAATQSTVLDTLTSNAATQSVSLSTLLSNAAAQEASLSSLVGNAATQSLAITSADANLGTATTNITTLFSNAATQSASINTTNANITAANAAILTLQTQVYTDSNVAAYLPVYTGNVGAGNITASNLYGNLQSPYQDGIVSVGTLDNLTVAGETVINGNLSLINNQILASDVYISGNLNLNNNTTIISTEEINSTVRHLILVHDVTNPVDALGAGLMTPFSAWTYNNTFNSWQSNVNLLPSASNTYDIGSDSGITWRSGHFGNIYGNIATPNQAQITSVGNLSALSVSGNSIFYGSVITSNLRPRSNAVYSLGTVDHQWKDLYVSENTIYIGGTALTVSNGSLSLDGNVVGGETYGNTEVNTYLSAFPGSINFTASPAIISGLGNISTANAYVSNTLTLNKLEFIDPSAYPLVIGSLTSVGNIEFSDSSYQTTAYGNVQVASYLPVYTGNVGAGNVTASNLYGNIKNPYQDSIISIGTLDNLNVSGPTILQGNLAFINSGHISTSDLHIDGNVYFNNNTTSISSEEINSNVRHLILVHNAASANAAAGAGLMTPYSKWTYNSVLDSWDSNVSIMPAANATSNIGLFGYRWDNGHFVHLYGQLGTVQQPELHLVGNLANLHTGTATLTGNLELTGDILYTMGNYQNWTSNVTTISSALDQLAERLKAAGF